MHAWLCEKPDGVDALQWREMPTPEPHAGEVRIAVEAASLNFPDLLIVQGKYQFKPPLPCVPGAEFAGLVDAVGSGVKHVSVGNKIAAIGGTGGFVSPLDRRVRLITPTTKGRDALRAVFPRVVRSQQRLLEPLARAEREEFMRLMKLLIDANAEPSNIPADEQGD